MLRVEFHCHTSFSKDSLTSPARLIEEGRAKGLNRIIITDHNSISGAIEAHQIAPDMVIIGEEIMTTQGELLAAFVQDELPAGLEPGEAISRLRAQGAFISVSHPFDVHRNGHWSEEDLIQIVPLVDAIEVFNSRCMRAEFNTAAQDFARAHQILGTAGSDAHAAFELGRAAMLLKEFDNSTSLKEALRTASAETTLSSPWVHFTSRYAVLRKSLRR